MKFGKIFCAVALVASLANPVYAGRYGGSSYSSSSSGYRSSSSYGSSGYRSSPVTSSYRSSNYGYGSSSTNTSGSRSANYGYQPQKSNYTPKSTYTSPKRDNNYGYNYQRSQGSNLTRNTNNYGSSNSGYRQTEVYHHYVQSPFGGTFSNPWFWMWAMDRNHTQTVVQQPVVVSAPQQNSGQIIPQQDQTFQQAPAQQYQVQDNGPGFFGYIWYFVLIIVQLIALAAFFYACWWLVKRFIVPVFRR